MTIYNAIGITESISIGVMLAQCADDYVAVRHSDSHVSFMLLHRPLHVRQGGSLPLRCRWTWAGKTVRGGNLAQLVAFCMRRHEQLPTYPKVLYDRPQA